MNAIAKRQLSLFALIAGAVIFGVVLASSMNWTPVTSAQHVTKSTTGHTTSMTLPSFAEIAQEALPSVVSITSTDIVKGPRRMSGGFGGGDGGSGDPFQFFFGFPHPGQGDDQQQEHKEEAGGSGFILSEDGYILTNNHVVENGQKIEVKVGDQHTYKAKVVGTDPATDIALLKIDAKEKLTPIALGDSDKLRVGDWVMAIGDPWAFDKTVTVGVVGDGLSAAHRRYLARGGIGFQLGDGRLDYAHEIVAEANYDAPVGRATSVGLDVQRVWNPGYNADRGPIMVYGVRLHLHRP